MVGFLIFVNLFVFVLAFFLDFFEIAFIIIPLLAPVADKLGIDLIWFGVLLGVNMQTSFMHPPFGFALFYLRAIAGKTVPTRDIYMGAIPGWCCSLVMVGIVIAFPERGDGAADQGAPQVDLNTIQIEVPMGDDGSNGGDLAPPSFGTGAARLNRPGRASSSRMSVRASSGWKRAL